MCIYVYLYVHNLHKCHSVVHGVVIIRMIILGEGGLNTGKSCAMSCDLVNKHIFNPSFSTPPVPLCWPGKKKKKVSHAYSRDRTRLGEEKEEIVCTYIHMYVPVEK